MKRDYKRVTLEERLLLKQALDENMLIADISQLLGWWTPKVYYELNKGGGRKNYDPYLSHKETKIREDRKKVGLHCALDKIKALEERVDSLEMQIEVILEAINGK